MFHQLKKLFKSKCKNRSRTAIQVSAMPPELLEKITAYGCSVPKQCFANCSLLLSNYDVADKYVLCFVKTPSGAEYGHALIKIGGEYFDPTLEPQGLISKSRYYFWREFDKSELRLFVSKWHEDIKPNENGEVDVYPPALKSDGTISCEAISA